MADLRRVRRLHLQAAREEDARRGAILIEDALRTASFPDADGGRMLVIRRLKLGRIPTHAGPGAVALQIERVFRALKAVAVPFDAQGAAAADVVAFPDSGSAILELARRHAQRASTAEWFWKQAVSGWEGAVSREHRWIVLLDEVTQLPAVAPLMAAVVHRAVLHGAHRELIRAVSPERARAFMQAAGWTFEAGIGASASDFDASASGVDGRVNPGFATGTLAVAADLPGDERAVWLLTLLEVYHHPARAADPHLPARARFWLSRSRRNAAGDGPAEEPLTESHAPPGDTFERRENKRAERIPRREEVPAPHHRGTGRYPSEPAAAEATAFTDEDIAAPADAGHGRRRADLRDLADAAATSCAGLFYLVPVLEQFGMGEWTAREPRLLETAYPARLLIHIALTENAAPEDAVVAVLDELGSRKPLPAAVDPPDAVRQLCEGLKPGASSFDQWLAAVRTWCSVTADVELSDLILRNGRIRCSQTHLDVYFDLNQVDVRVRRVGLDIDPGWVPWLGRVVLFHYG